MAPSMTNLYPLPPGLIAVTGGERSGKTSLLRRLCGELAALPGETPPTDAHWLDLSLPGQDDAGVAGPACAQPALEQRLA